MKILVIVGATLCLSTSQAFAQVKAPVSRQAGDCSVNITGNANSVSLVCRNVDPKLAEQVRAILNGTQRNEKDLKEISQKLDPIVKGVGRPVIHIEQRSEGPNSPNTVNINQRPPPRRIPPDKRAEIVAILKRRPAKIQVLAIIGNAEAYQFAQDWYDAFKAAGWTMMDGMVRLFEYVGRPEPGVQFHLRGETVPAALPFEVPRNSPVGALSEGFETLKMAEQLRGQRFPGRPEDEVSLWIHQQPEN
jgi:hypothetical protein